MIALVILFFLAIYLLITAFVMGLAARWAKRRGRRGWVWAGVAAFGMYNLVFWDLIPTLLVHKYYCETEAGFWVYKTPEEWAQENPGVLETLEPWPASKIYGEDRVEFEWNGGTVTQFNDRFGSWSKWDRGLNGLLINRLEGGIVDVDREELLTYSVRFFSGPRGAGVLWKSWLKRSDCDDELAHKYVDRETLFLQQLNMIKER